MIKSDPGYIDHSYRYEVRLDGEYINTCVTADEEKGYVICHLQNEDGDLVLDPSGQSTAKIKRYGKVEIERI